MTHSKLWISGLSLGAILTLAPAAVFAAGGSSAPPPTPAPTQQLTPEEEAIQFYNDGIQHRDKAWKLEEKASAATVEAEKEKLLGKMEKQFEKAVKKFESALERKPIFHQAHSSLGYALRRLGRYDEALVAYDRALELNPHYSEAIEYRAEAYLGLNRIEDAKAAYMSLFASDRPRADELLDAMEEWLAARKKDPAGVEAREIEEFEAWFEGRAELAQKTAQLAPALRSW